MVLKDDGNALFEKSQPLIVQLEAHASTHLPSSLLFSYL
jgi:hypothetical protein